MSTKEVTWTSRSAVRPATAYCPPVAAAGEVDADAAAKGFMLAPAAGDCGGGDGETATAETATGETATLTKAIEMTVLRQAQAPAAAEGQRG